MKRTIMRFTILALAAAAACTPPNAHRGDGRASSGGMVDSVLPWDTALARFRADLEEPAGLQGGAASREELVRRFIHALERRDTAALARLVVDRAEFSYFYYPTSPFARPPYDLAPGLMWFNLETRSRRGISWALHVLGGRPLGYLDHACPPDQRRVEGSQTLWLHCVVRRAGSGDTTHQRLFGVIVERQGRYKFLSYANRL